MEFLHRRAIYCIYFTPVEQKCNNGLYYDNSKKKKFSNHILRAEAHSGGGRGAERGVTCFHDQSGRTHKMPKAAVRGTDSGHVAGRGVGEGGARHARDILWKSDHCRNFSFETGPPSFETR